MVDYFYKMTDFQIFLILSILFVMASVAGISLVKSFIPLNIRIQDNPVIGTISGLIGIIYGVLAGLTALYLVNNLGYTADAVQREANATANIYRDSKWLEGPVRTQIQVELSKYLTNVIEVEWPLMEKGKDLNNNGDLIIDRMSQILNSYRFDKNVDLLVLRNLTDELKNLYNSREQRIYMSFSTLNPEIWFVIVIGTILTIAINYLFGMNFYLHILTVSAAALMCSSMIYLLITLDRPFQGEFVIQPIAFRSVLDFIKKDAQTANPQMTYQIEGHETM